MAQMGSFALSRPGQLGSKGSFARRRAPCDQPQQAIVIPSRVNGFVRAISIPEEGSMGSFARSWASSPVSSASLFGQQLHCYLAEILQRYLAKNHDRLSNDFDLNHD